MTAKKQTKLTELSLPCISRFGTALIRARNGCGFPNAIYCVWGPYENVNILTYFGEANCDGRFESIS